MNRMWAVACVMNTWAQRHSFLTLLLCGIAGALTLPPVSWLWLLPFVWSLAYHVWGQVSGEGSGKRRFRLGWAFGIGYFAAGLYWVSYAFLVEPELYGWLIPFVLIGLGAGLGLFSGLAFWAAGRLPSHPAVQWAGFSACWMLVECLRGWVLTGFPWNTVGSIWAPYPMWSQGAAFIGMYGLSFVTILIMTAPAAGLSGAFGASRPLLRGCGVALFVLILQGGGGWLRLPSEPVPVQPDVKLRLVQPNISQQDKWDNAKRYDNVLNTILMSQKLGWASVTHVIWPETAVTYPLSAEGKLYRKLVSQAVPNRGWLLTGAPRRTPRGVPFQVWNSIYAIDEHGEIGDIYDKSHLVPFGEYVPLGQYLPLMKLTAGRVDFTPGSGPRTVSIPHTPPYSPLVCYEIIFPDQVVNADQRPDWLLNVTNDGWFGMSSGPYQHWAAAVMRAVEQGLPVVRAANTGVSGVVDPYGQVVAQIGLGQKAVLDVYLPQPLVKTVYSLTGIKGPIVFSLCFVLLVYAAALRFFRP